MSIVRVGLGELVLRSDAGPGGELVVRSGAEAAGLTEALYVGLLAVALWGMQVVCAMSVVIAFRAHGPCELRAHDDARCRPVDAVRVGAQVPRPLLPGDAALAAAVAQPAGRGASLVALVIDGVSHSPMSYPASVGIAMTAFVHGRRWALVAATLVSVGAIAAAMLNAGLGALNSVGQGAAGYFVWALVCAGLAESFVLLILRLPQPDPSPAPPSEPVRVPNLGSDPVGRPRIRPPRTDPRHRDRGRDHRRRRPATPRCRAPAT